MRMLILLISSLLLACDGTTTAGGGGGGGGGAQCALTNFTGATTQDCFDCMREKCCAELQACDEDPDCVYCAGDVTDSSARCVDPNTFAVYERQDAMNRCQNNLCVPPCGVPGSTRCSPSNCHSSCPNFTNGCR